MGDPLLRALAPLAPVLMALAVAIWVSGCGGSDAQASRQPVEATYVTSHPFPVGPFEQTGGFVTCPEGQVAVGGGGYGSSANPLQSMDASIPRKGAGSSVPNQWAAWFNNGTPMANSFVVYAVCISPAQTRVASSFVQH